MNFFKLLLTFLLDVYNTLKTIDILEDFCHFRSTSSQNRIQHKFWFLSIQVINSTSNLVIKGCLVYNSITGAQMDHY